MGNSIWSSEKFLRENNPQYPFKKDYAIIYRKTSREIFYKESAQTLRQVKEKNVLNKGYLLGQNGFYNSKDEFTTEYSSEEVKSKKLTSASHGVYGTFLECTSHFEGDIVLELRVPTSDLALLVSEDVLRQLRNGKPDDIVGGDYQDVIGIQNMVQIDQAFGNEEIFQKLCRKTAKNEIHYESIQFIIPHEVPIGPRAKENWVPRVWDQEFSKKPAFEPLNQYVKTLKHRYPEKVAAGKNSKLKEKLDQELEVLKKVDKEINKLQKKSTAILNAFEILEQKNNPQNAVGLQEKILRQIFGGDKNESWNQVVINLEEILEENLGINPDIDHQPISEMKELEEETARLKDELQNMITKIEEIRTEERQKILEEGTSEDTLEEALNYDKQLEKKALQEISSIHNPVPVGTNIKKRIT